MFSSANGINNKKRSGQLNGSSTLPFRSQKGIMQKFLDNYSLSEPSQNGKQVIQNEVQQRNDKKVIIRSMSAGSGLMRASVMVQPDVELVEKFLTTEQNAIKDQLSPKPTIASKPPWLNTVSKVADSQNHPNWSKRPGYVSAEAKIFNELAEMKRREAELMRERIRIGRSDLNISNCGLEEHIIEERKLRSGLKTALSTSDLSEMKERRKPLRNRALADAWEKRIKSNVENA